MYGGMSMNMGGGYGSAVGVGGYGASTGGYGGRGGADPRMGGMGMGGRGGMTGPGGYPMAGGYPRPMTGADYGAGGYGAPYMQMANRYTIVYLTNTLLIYIPFHIRELIPAE